MGPISDFTPDIARSASTAIANNTDKLNFLSQILEDPGAWTSSGKIVNKPITSKAILNSTTGAYLQEFEGKTVSEATKTVAKLRNENAILEAVKSLGTEIAKDTPTIKTPPALATPGLMTKLNPILSAITLLTHSPELNTGESEELASRQTQGFKP